MPDYQFRFIKSETGRKNIGRKYAYDEAELFEILAKEGVVPIEVEALPARMVTEPQLAYLSNLGVSVPPALTLEEASDLIDNAKGRHAPVGLDGHALARRFRVEVTKYVSKRSLYKRITNSCAQAEDPYELALWFTYRVYRANFDRTKSPQSGLDDPRLQLIARDLVADVSSLRSLKKAAASPFSTGFRWFGQMRAPNGETHTGESRGTACFKFAHGRLSALGLVPAQPKSDKEVARAIKRSSTPEEKARMSDVPAARSGCLVAAFWLFAPPVVLLLLYASRWTA